MNIKKGWHKNLSIYSSIGLIVVFLALGGYIKIGLISKIILLISAITSILFIITRVIYFKNFKGDG